MESFKFLSVFTLFLLSLLTEKFPINTNHKKINQSVIYLFKYKFLSKQLTTFFLKDETFETNASLLSNLTFWWITSTIFKGYKKALSRKDLWKIEKNENSQYLSARLNKAWKHRVTEYNDLLTKLDLNEKLKTNSKENGNDFERETLKLDFKEPKLHKKISKPSLAFCLFKIYYGKFLAGSFLKFINDLLNFVPPIVLDKLINYFKDKEQNALIGFLYAFVLFLTLITRTLIYNHYVYKMKYVGARVRTSLMNLIYEKSLNLSSKSRRLTSMGEMSNLISVDSQVFIDFMTYVNMIWSAPLQIVLCIALLWQYLGVASLAGLFVMLLSFPLNGYVSEQARKLDVKKLLFQDSRIKMINELLNGIKVIKFYGWELSFQRIIEKIRKNEMTYLIKSAFLKCGNLKVFNYLV